MESSWARARDIIVFNYLRQNNFDEVADSFKALRNISASKADAFKHLTLQKISNFVERKTAQGIDEPLNRSKEKKLLSNINNSSNNNNNSRNSTNSSSNNNSSSSSNNGNNNWRRQRLLEQACIV
jgi:hypothetical protein